MTFFEFCLFIDGATFNIFQKCNEKDFFFVKKDTVNKFIEIIVSYCKFFVYFGSFETISVILQYNKSVSFYIKRNLLKLVRCNFI